MLQILQNLIDNSETGSRYIKPILKRYLAPKYMLHLLKKKDCFLKQKLKYCCRLEFNKALC